MEKPHALDAHTLLLVRAGDQRLAVPLSEIVRLEEFPAKALERSAGRDVIQYRGQILPVMPLWPGWERREASSLPAIVFHHRGGHVALLVDEIIDIVTAGPEVQPALAKPGTLGSAVIGHRVTELVDVPAMLAAADEAAFRQGPEMSATAERAAWSAN
jgi:two-component system chemotaxis sensor kinase CheA